MGRPHVALQATRRRVFFSADRRQLRWMRGFARSRRKKAGSEERKTPKPERRKIEEHLNGMRDRETRIPAKGVQQCAKQLCQRTPSSFCQSNCPLRGSRWARMTSRRSCPATVVAYPDDTLHHTTINSRPRHSSSFHHWRVMYHLSRFHNLKLCREEYSGFVQLVL
jgi:hypothetical protein